MQRDTLAILVGGGPAPGINGVIAAAAIEAINNGLRVVGIYDGYRHLADGGDLETVELTIESVARVHATGGSILRTSRTNPAATQATLDNCVSALERLGARYLVCIGGDDTTFGATKIAERTRGRLGVVTVPKTIDNDLPLPDDAPTFGFETARAGGTSVIESLLEDARTTQRWYLVVSMGRKSGSLALGMCKAAGATLAVIPEEFGDQHVNFSLIVDTLAGSIIKRLADGISNGVAVIAEGMVERLAPEDVAAFAGVARDSYGHVRLADVPLGALLRDAVRERLQALGIDATVVTKDIGYELRCAKPIAFDVDYTRTLGYGAVRYLLGGGSGALIALAGGRVVPLTLDDMLDPVTGRIRTRSVDVTAEAYQVARSYMTYLQPDDVQGARAARLAATTNLTVETFSREFARVCR